MFAHLLFAADGSDGREGSNNAALLRCQATGDRVSVMTTAKPWSAVTNGDASAFA
jgi:Asp/Glu/hydantoin racemase